MYVRQQEAEERVEAYDKVGEIDNGPCHARGAAKDGEDEQP